jgi:hypothetical protein
VTYSSGLKDFASGTAERAQTVLVRLELRSLGSVGTATTVGGIEDILLNPVEKLSNGLNSLIQ